MIVDGVHLITVLCGPIPVELFLRGDPSYPLPPAVRYLHCDSEESVRAAFQDTASSSRGPQFQRPLYVAAS